MMEGNSAGLLKRMSMFNLVSNLRRSRSQPPDDFNTQTDSFLAIAGHMDRLKALEAELDAMPPRSGAVEFLRRAHETSDAACFSLTAAQAQYEAARAEYEARFSPLRRGLKQFGKRTQCWRMQNVEPREQRLQQAQTLFQKAEELKSKVEASVALDDELIADASIDPLYASHVSRSYGFGSRSHAGSAMEGSIASQMDQSCFGSEDADTIASPSASPRSRNSRLGTSGSRSWGEPRRRKTSESPRRPLKSEHGSGSARESRASSEGLRSSTGISSPLRAQRLGHRLFAEDKTDRLGNAGSQRGIVSPVKAPVKF